MKAHFRPELTRISHRLSIAAAESWLEGLFRAGFHRLITKTGGKSGFTLMELIVVVGIMGILTSIAVPVVVRYLPTYRLNGVASDIANNLQLARITAIQRNNRVVAAFTPGAYTAQGQVGSYMIFLDTNQDWKTTDSTGSAEPTIIASTTMPANVSLYQATFTDNGNGQANATQMAGFDTHGLAAKSTSGAFVFGTVTLRNSVGKYARVTVMATGQVKMEYSNNGVNWY